MQNRAIIFDLDGTLLNTTEGILESVAATINKLELLSLSQEDMLQFVGPPIQESFIRFYNMDKEGAQKAANIFRTHYKKEALLKASPYHGILELMRELHDKQYTLAVATYKREDYAILILEHFGLTKYCNVIHGADNDNQLSKADIVELCINEMTINPNYRSATILVGDSEYDAIGAQIAKIQFIGVTYGFGFKDKSDVDSFANIGCAKDVKELKDILLQNRLCK